MSKSLKDSLLICLNLIKKLLEYKNMDFETFTKKIKDCDIISIINNLRGFQTYLIKEIFKEPLKSADNIFCFDIRSSDNNNNLLELNVSFTVKDNYSLNRASNICDISNSEVRRMFNDYFDRFIKTNNFYTSYVCFKNDINSGIKDSFDRLHSVYFTEEKLTKLFEVINYENITEYIDKIIKIVNNMDKVEAYITNYTDICMEYDKSNDDKRREDLCKFILHIEETLGEKIFSFQPRGTFNRKISFEYNLNWFSYIKKHYDDYRRYIYLNDNEYARINRNLEKIFIENRNKISSNSKDFSSFDYYDNFNIEKHYDYYWKKCERVGQ